MVAVRRPRVAPPGPLVLVAALAVLTTAYDVFLDRRRGALAALRDPAGLPDRRDGRRPGRAGCPDSARGRAGGPGRQRTYRGGAASSARRSRRPVRDRCKARWRGGAAARHPGQPAGRRLGRYKLGPVLAYTYLWSLPARVRDPGFTQLAPSGRAPRTDLGRHPRPGHVTERASAVGARWARATTSSTHLPASDLPASTGVRRTPAQVAARCYLPLVASATTTPPRTPTTTSSEATHRPSTDTAHSADPDRRPTYDEAENIATLLDRVLGPCRRPRPGRRRQQPRRHRRPRARRPTSAGACTCSAPGKAGLGAAYRAGFTWALAPGLRPRRADGRRPLAPAGAGAGAAGGARRRRHVGRLALRAWRQRRQLVVVAAADLVAGQRLRPHRARAARARRHRRVQGLPAAALEEIGALSSQSNGYCFQIENTWQAVRRGLHVVEVPITFTDRALGQSKMSSRIVLEAIIRVLGWRLRWSRGSSHRGTATTSTASYPMKTALSTIPVLATPRAAGDGVRLG